MYARRCRRALRAGVSRGRRAGLVLVALGAATIACSTAMGQPAVDGEWNDPPNTGTDWFVMAMHAAHLPNGSILVWESPFQEPYLWDPVLDTLTEIPTDFKIGCTGHAGLSDGTTLLAGGVPSTVETKVFSLGALFGGPWEQVEDMIYSRFTRPVRHCPTAGWSRTPVGMKTAVRCSRPRSLTPERTPSQGTWQEMMIETTAIGRRYPHMFVVPDDDPDVQKVFFSSSLLPLSFDTDQITYILDIGPPATWTAVGGVPPFSTSRVSAVMYEPGLVLKSGGNDYLFGGTIDETATINLNDAVPTWQSELPMIHRRQRHNLVLLPDGKILAVGGHNADMVKEAEWVDPALGIWEDLAAMNIGRANHSTAMLLADGRVLSAGGDGIPEGTAEIFSPPYLFWGARPVIGFAPTVVQ